MLDVESRLYQKLEVFILIRMNLTIRNDPVRWLSLK